MPKCLCNVCQVLAFCFPSSPHRSPSCCLCRQVCLHVYFQNMLQPKKPLENFVPVIDHVTSGWCGVVRPELNRRHCLQVLYGTHRIKIPPKCRFSLLMKHVLLDFWLTPTPSSVENRVSNTLYVRASIKFETDCGFRSPNTIKQKLLMPER